MPYILSTKKVKGKKKFCMKSKTSGKVYCYSSATARKKGMKMHEMFSRGWKPTRLKKKK